MSRLPGGSTLITRAPKSARNVDANGPARAWERSSTVMSSSAIGIPGVPPSVHGDEEAAARLAVERLGAMPFAPRVLDEDDLAGADAACFAVARGDLHARDRKSTRLNSSHITISYAVFCLKKKNRS